MERPLHGHRKHTRYGVSGHAHLTYPVVSVNYVNWNYMFLAGQVSGLVENLNIWIFSDTINVINVKLCMMVLHIDLYLFITLQ